jgi:D-alanyl-D-alanine carboxypeptidase/D-alanyl-D-alanine-endopeptidase (penicillin-binding protein 4)
MMKDSQNLYAQLLLLQVGERHREKAAARRRQAPNAGQEPSFVAHGSSEAWGLEALREFLKEAGISERQVLLEEGAGLSRADLATPAATVALLRFMHRHPHREAFRNSLPVAGEDGTLRRRMRGTAAMGNARAKTGSMRQVETLSGYVQTAARENLAFSIFLNGYPPSAGTRPAREELDALVVMLAELSGRTTAPAR